MVETPTPPSRGLTTARAGHRMTSGKDGKKLNTTQNPCQPRPSLPGEGHPLSQPHCGEDLAYPGAGTRRGRAHRPVVAGSRDGLGNENNRRSPRLGLASAVRSRIRELRQYVSMNGNPAEWESLRHETREVPRDGVGGPCC